MCTGSAPGAPAWPRAKVKKHGGGGGGESSQKSDCNNESCLAEFSHELLLTIGNGSLLKGVRPHSEKITVAGEECGVV